MQRKPRTGEWIEGYLVRFMIPYGVTTIIPGNMICPTAEEAQEWREHVIAKWKTKGCVFEDTWIEKGRYWVAM